MRQVRRLAPWSVPLLAGLLVLGAVSFMGAAQWIAGDGIFIDWLAYSLGTERVLRGESLYLPVQLAGPYHLPDVTPAGYIYPPPSAVLFAPFALGYVGLAAWLAVNVVLLLSGLAAVLRREMGAVRPVPLAWVLLGLLVAIPIPGHVLQPLGNGVVNANANVGLAGLLAWTWASGAQRGWIPVAAGVGAVVKLFPGALALWAARSSGWRPVALAGAVAAAIVLVTLPLTGFDEWRSFLVALSNAEPTCDGGRTSIACLAQPFVGTSVAKATGVVVGVLLLGAAVVARGEYRAFVLLTAGMLAPLADGHQHYLLFLYVLIVIGVARWWAPRLDARRPGAHVATAGDQSRG